jgi:hypothetical protein
VARIERGKQGKFDCHECKVRDYVRYRLKTSELLHRLGLLGRVGLQVQPKNK